MTPTLDNPKSMKLFLEQHPFLKTTELAQIVGCSNTTIRRYRKRFGMVTAKPSFFRPYRPPLITTETYPPSVWNNREWLEQKYTVEGYGMRVIAFMIGRTIEYVYRRLLQFGIKTRPKIGSVSKNPCYSKEWLVENHIILGRSIRHCARIASVNPYTIYNWAAKFGVVLRDKHSCLAGDRSPTYGKSVCKKNGRMDRVATKNHHQEA
jgi:transposase-like protein